MKFTLITGLIQLLVLGSVSCVLTDRVAIAENSTLEAPADHHIFHMLKSTSDTFPGSVTVIFRDSYGYTWLGTAHGLFRHDGYDFENKSDNQDYKLRLSHQYVFDLKEDSFGNLWVATKYGLDKLSLKTNAITHYFSSDQQGNTSVTDGLVRTLWLGKKRLLVGMSNGLEAIDLNSNDISTVLKGHYIRSLYYDEAGVIWVGTNNGGLLKYIESSKTVKSFDFSDILGDKPVSVRKILLYKSDLWLGTDSGLIQFDPKANKIKSSLLDDVSILDMVVESEGNLWIATVEHGLYRYSLNDGVLKHFTFDPADKISIKNNTIYSLLLDELSNRLWVGNSAGVYTLDLLKPVYLIRRHFPGKKNAWSFYRQQDNDLLIGAAKGLNVYNTEYATYRHHELEQTPYGVVSDNSKIWLAMGDGVYELDKATHKVVNMTPEIHHLANKSNKIILDINKRNKNQLLIASQYGLIQWDWRTKQDEVYTFIDELNQPDMDEGILKIYKYNSTWLVGTRYGLYIVDFKEKKLRRYLADEKITPLDKTTITAIASDSNGYIWAGGSDGLFKLKDRKIIAVYGKADGIPDLPIIHVAAYDNLVWVSTHIELAAFQISDNKFEKTYLNNNIFDIGFNRCGSENPNNGHLYFCSPEGLFYFNPKIFVQSAIPPKARITSFRLFNQPQEPGSKWLPQAIEYSDQLILDYHQSMLSFEFSALSYNQPKHLYAYQMLGITKDDEWVVTDSQNRMATFTAQNPGDYTFRVKAGWDEKNWSDEITELKVTILPPWWRTDTAYFSYVLILLLSIIWIIKARTNRLHEQAVLLKQQVTERTEEIQGLLEKKNELFANVSHELRTPLTLILGPADRGLHRDVSEEVKNDFRLIRRSGQRLRTLVEQLLLFSKLSHFESLDAKPCYVKKAIQIVCSSMTSLMDENQLTLNVGSVPDVWVKLSPPDALQTILLNLLGNSAKYTPAGGEIDLSVNITNDAQVQIRIRDSGVGIPEDWQDKIFERFARLPEHVKSDIPGTGLGLPMVKDLVEMNAGYIKLSNVKEGGAVFTVVIPSYQPTTEEWEIAEAINISSFEAIQREAMEPISTTGQAQKQDSGKPTLIVIDDTIDMRAYLASELSHEFNVLLAEDGESGLQLMRQHGPDLVICDVMMPGIDGFEVLKCLRDDINISHIPLILLTAKEGKESRIKGYEERADDYIVKPFEMDELKARIKNILDLRKLWREQAHIALVNTTDELHELVQNYAGKDKRFLEKFKTVLDEHYQDPDLDMGIICDKMHLSHSSLYRKVKSLLGSPPHQCLRIYRLQKAAHILKSGYQGNMGQLAEAMGFSSQQYFNKSFKGYFGMAPKDYGA